VLRNILFVRDIITSRINCKFSLKNKYKKKVVHDIYIVPNLYFVYNLQCM